MSPTTGAVLGYDPGGDGKHGVAILNIAGGRPRSLETDSLPTAEDALNFFASSKDVLAIGIDTLTCWSTGPSGWRPADRWLRKRYPRIGKSVVSPNGLYGSMGLNGPSVLIALRTSLPHVVATETHPKVLYWRMANERYDFAGARARMQALLADELDIRVEAASEHAWDAALSALAAFKGQTGHWSGDLHRLPTESGERLVWPCGPTHYFWPDAEDSQLR